MSWVITGDIAEYDEAAGGFLRSRPVENTVLVTVLESLRARGLTAYGDAPAVLGAWLPAAGCVAGAFVYTPPFPLLLSVMPEQAVVELPEALTADGRRPQGVTARREIAETFATRWCAVTGVDFEVWERRRLYRLGKVRPSASSGRARPAEPADRDLLLAWYHAAEREIRERPGDHGAAVDDRIGYGGVTLWEKDGVPVSLAGRTRMVAGMVRIAPVYTPPEHRFHGYGAAVTAAVSQAAVDAGAKEVVVFADLANPGSNTIQQRIGYQPLDDYLVISFRPPV
ncbi:GNAT family N-acetyltransferase [Actinomadura sp. HBU206391]|uniref:GNAT family N-acetyltransferase n=1 Tax=Actinomadura sp. HBU206391 TaxID=2731692 RepID=UPI00164F984E|nr:GNAT family N-acetyltransferase [Actinomadura sp. HBU206391]MBC6461349.1 GNAT family N-acetyltransferase [Actinomadura sp. HBU206391]